MNVARVNPITAISDPNITAEQLVQRVGLDLVETAVGDAIMGSSIHLETFMANELGSNLGGRIAGPLADYLNAQSKVPAPSTQQIQQDSLSPNDAQYRMATAAGQGQGMSPDYLEPHPGSDDPDDVFNYYLAMRDASNIPAAQSNTRSQVTQNMLKQQSQAARMQGIPVNYPAALPNADTLDYLLNPMASNAQSRSNAMCYVGSSLNVPDPHVAPDLLSELHDIQQNLAWKNGISVLPAPNSAARTTNNPTAQVGWFRRDVNAVSSFADELGAVLKVTSMLTTSTMTPQAADIAKVKSFAASHWQDAAVAGFVALQFTGAGEVIDAGIAAGEGFVAGMRAVTPVVAKALQSAGFFGRGGVVGEIGVENSERFTQIFSGISKTEARQLLRSNDHPLTAEQTQKVLGYLKKGSADRISLKISNTTGEARLSSERGGRVDGYQRMTYGIDAEGNTNKVVQTAFNDQDQLIRQSPGSPKNNLYDVKKWW